MPYLIHPLSEGKFEIIDKDFLHLYELAESEVLIELSDEAYQIHQTKQNHLTTVENGGFVYRDIDIDTKALKAQAQAQAWEAIKQKRHDNTRGGVFIKSVGKWFHNDDPSRTQYLALQVLPSLPPGLMWKTMDNTFVKMTKALLAEIAMTMLLEEQVNFANAENHRVEMLKADDPLSYDYSTGWGKTYE